MLLSDLYEYGMNFNPLLVKITSECPFKAFASPDA